MMGADHGAVDHLQGRWNHPALVQGLQYPFPQPGQGPAPELAVDGRPLAELFRQVRGRLRERAKSYAKALANDILR